MPVHCFPNLSFSSTARIHHGWLTELLRSSLFDAAAPSLPLGHTSQCHDPMPPRTASRPHPRSACETTARQPPPLCAVRVQRACLLPCSGLSRRCAAVGRPAGPAAEVPAPLPAVLDSLHEQQRFSFMTTYVLLRGRRTERYQM